MRRHDGLSRRDPATSPPKDRGVGLRSTRAHAVAARPSTDRPAPHREYTRSSSGQRAAHISYLKANSPQAATQKVTLDAKESRKD